MTPAWINLCQGVSGAFCDQAGLSGRIQVNQRDPAIPALIGQCVLVPALCRLIPAGMRPQEEHLWWRADILSDPLASLLGQNPIRTAYLADFDQVALRDGLAEALSRPDWHHPTHAKLALDLFLKGVRTCLKNGCDGTAPLNGKENPTLLGRLREQRRPLEAPDCSGGDFDARVHSAIANLPEERRTRNLTINGKVVKVPYFSNATFQEEIAHHLPNTWVDEIAKRAKGSIKAIRAVGRMAVIFAASLCADVPSKAEIDRVIDLENSGGNRRILVAGTWDLPYAIPPARGIGIATLHRFLQHVSRLEKPAHVVWCCVLFLFIRLENLPRIERMRAGGVLFVGQPIRDPQEAGSPSLHRERRGQLVLPVPGRLEQALRGLPEGDALLPHIDMAKRWLGEEFPGITPAKLYAAVTTVGSAYFRYPWIIAHAGLYPDRRKVPAPRSYVALSHKLWGLLEPYYRRLDPGYQAPTNLYKYCAGSGNTPSDQSIRAYFATWRRLLDRPLTGVSPTDWVDSWNAIAAGANQAVFLTAGLRAYGLPPFLAREAAWWQGEIHRQKEFFGTHFCPALVALLQKCERQRLLHEKAIRGAGLSLDLENISGTLSMMRIEEGRLRYVVLGPLDIAGAHLVSSELHGFAGFFPGMTRHFAATRLRERGVEEMEARMFLGHHSRAVSPFSVFRLETALSRRRRLELAELLGREAGLWG